MAPKLVYTRLGSTRGPRSRDGRCCAAPPAARRCWRRPACRPGRARSPRLRPGSAGPTACRSRTCRPARQSMPQIEHIVVLMMENHSFDNLLGMVPYEVTGRDQVDGLTSQRRPASPTSIPTPSGNRIFATPTSSPCQLDARADAGLERDRTRPTTTAPTTASCYASGADRDELLGQARPAVHLLARASTSRSASATSARCSRQTYPNRRFLFAGTASGPIGDRRADVHDPGRQRDDLRPARRPRHQLGRLLPRTLPSYADRPRVVRSAASRHAPDHDSSTRTSRAGKLPSFTFLDPNYGDDLGGEPAGRPGRRAVRARASCNALMHGPNVEAARRCS